MDEKKVRIGVNLSWCHKRTVQSAPQLRNTSGRNGDHTTQYTGALNLKRKKQFN